jgi:uncharacterized protein (DUF2141 family)
MKIIAAITAAAFATLAVSGHAAPAATPPAVVAATATLTVRFTGIATPTGAVLLSLFASEADFDAGGKPVASMMAPVKGDAAEAVFTGLAPGRYAVKAFHDVDGDGKMATTPFGMPLEPYAFSNDAVGDAGPAKWAAANFAVAAGALVHSIKIR